MCAAANPLASHGGLGQGSDRREPREQLIRRVEYTPFPRVAAGDPMRLGFTRDLSPSGMCLRAETSQRVGSLLRVTVRDLDGHPARESLVRVAWSSSTADGAFWLGLSLVEDKPAVFAS